MPRPFAVIGFTVFFTIALLFNSGTGVTVAALAVFTAALVISLLIKSVRNNRAIPCSMASAVLACVLLLVSDAFVYNPAVSYNGKTCEISAALISKPEYEYGNCYYIARAEKIDSEEADLKFRIVFPSVPDADPYDIVQGKFTFYVPGESNEATLVSNISSGVYVAAYPDSDEEYTVITIPESDKPILKKIIDIRLAIKNAIYRVLPNENGALAVALLIGDKSGLSSETLNNFSFTGISHIICVSGYHLSLWSMLAYELLGKFRFRTRISSIVSIVFVVFFMLVSGFTYSVLRSGIMMIIYFISDLILRKRDPLNSLGFALVVIALINPFAMASASLKLSVLATAGIIIYDENVKPKIDKLINKINIIFLRRTVSSFVSVFMITASATAFTLPVSLLLYNRFNFIVFISNLVAVPLSGTCMVLCSIGAIVGCFTSDIINIPAYFGGLLSKFLIWFSDSLSNLKFLSFYIEKDETAIIIISLFLICVFALLLAYNKKPFVILTSVLCSLVFVITTVTFSLTERSISRVRVVDCGNATSIVLSKGNESVVIGCGGSEYFGQFNLCHAIEDSGNNINALIFPDAEKKSSAYILNIINDFHVNELYCNSYPDYIRPLIKNIEIRSFNEGYTCSEFNISCDTINNKSIAYINNEDIAVLLLFDPFEEIGMIPEKYLDADVVISRNDYPIGIEKISPSLVVINAENTKGLILQKELSDFGMNCAATAGCGDIIIKADNGFVSAYRED